MNLKIGCSSVCFDGIDAEIDGIDTRDLDTDDVAKCVSVEIYVGAHDESEIARELDTDVIISALEDRGYVVTQEG